jgi:hypothetical protein
VNQLSDGLYTFSIGLAMRISERMQLSIDLLDVAFITAATSKF